MTNKNFFDDLQNKNKKIAIIGLGYIGIPLLIKLGRHFRVIGFDLRDNKLEEIREKSNLSDFPELKELDNTDYLLTSNEEDLAKFWHQRDDFLHLKRALIPQVARMVRRIHGCGMNHRDLYICHIHVSKRWLDNPVSYPELFIIDLHRAQVRSTTPQRWRELPDTSPMPDSSRTPPP